MSEVVDPQYKTTDGSALRVWKAAAKNNFLSEKFGRPIFDDATYVEVISPGSRDSTPVFEVRRFFAPEMGIPDPSYGMNWDRYKEFISQFDKTEETDVSMAGTPLREWKELPRTMEASLRAQNIFTVEALANLPDSRLTAVGMDGRSWRTKAQAYIASTQDWAYAPAIAAENERLKGELDGTKAQLKAMGDQIAALQAGQAQADQTPPVDPLDALPASGQVPPDAPII